YRSSGRMDFLRPEVGLARRIFSELVTEPLELTAPNIGEIFARRRRCCALVEVDGNPELTADPLAEGAREGDAVLHRRAIQWHKGDDVGRADAGMLASVVAEVDPFRRGLDSGIGGVDRGLDRRDEGDNRTVVRC